MNRLSARVNEETNESAEEIANHIGLSLSTAINIFLKRFMADQGLPFDVKMKRTKQNIMEMTAEEITGLVNQRIAQSADVAKLPKVSFFDIQSNTLMTENDLVVKENYIKTCSRTGKRL